MIISEFLKGNSQIVKMRDNPKDYDFGSHSQLVHQNFINKFHKESDEVLKELRDLNQSIRRYESIFAKVKYLVPYTGHELILQTKKGREAYENHRRNIAVKKIQKWARHYLPYKIAQRLEIERQMELQMKIDEKTRQAKLAYQR